MSIKTIYENKVKSNFSSEAKGLEKVVLRGTLSMIDITDGMDKIFYGKPIESGSYVKGKNIPKNPLDLGIIPVLDLINSVDYCDVINYAISKVPAGSKFNPLIVPEDPFEKIKWRFQKTAFDVRSEIDTFYSGYDDALDNESKTNLFNSVGRINSLFSTWTNGFRNAINADGNFGDQDLQTLTTAFPQLRNIGSFVTDKLEYYNRFTDFRQIPNEDYQKLLNTINKIRQYCIIIESLSTPASVITGLNLLGINGQINDAIKKVQDLIDPTKAIPTIKKIIKVCVKIRNICNSIKNLIATGQLLIKIALLLIRVFKVFIKFFKALPLANLFTTTGITTTFSDIVKDLKDKGASTFETRLKQLSLFFNFVIIFLDTLVPILGEVIQKLTTLITSLQNCDNFPKEVLNELIDVKNGLQSDLDEFNKFLENKKQKDKTKKSQNRFGDFTIQIVTEEVVEEAISLRRRYGVALNNRGLVTVQSDPTFASDDQIIIQEVKLLLQSKGVIDSASPDYNSEELNLLNDTSAYLYEDDINWESFEQQSLDLDSPNNENEDEDNLGLNAFVNKLDGGKRLRRRMRKMLEKNNQTLRSNLSNTDPSGRYSSRLSSTIPRNSQA